jgi:hypothetical protein
MGKPKAPGVRPSDLVASPDLLRRFLCASPSRGGHNWRTRQVRTRRAVGVLRSRDKRTLFRPIDLSQAVGFERFRARLSAIFLSLMHSAAVVVRLKDCSRCHRAANVR